MDHQQFAEGSLLSLMSQMGPLATWMTALGVSEWEERKVTQNAFVLVPETMCASHLEPHTLKRALMERQTAPRMLTQRLAGQGSRVKEAAPARPVVSLPILALTTQDTSTLRGSWWAEIRASSPHSCWSLGSSFKSFSLSKLSCPPLASTQRATWGSKQGQAWRKQHP